MHFIQNILCCWYLFKLNYNLHVLSIKYRCTDNCVCHLNLETSSSSTPTQSEELPKLQCRNRTNRGQKGASNKGNKGKAPAKKIRTEVSRENKFSYYKRWPLYNRYLVISELIQTQEKLWQLWFDDSPKKNLRRWADNLCVCLSRFHTVNLKIM